MELAKQRYSTEIKSRKLSITSVEVHKINEQTGVEKQIIREMLLGNEKRIQDLENNDIALSVKIPVVAINNGVFKPLEVTTVGEIAKMILEQFSHFSMDEIDLAYRLYASGRLQVNGSADTFGGVFSILQVGKVLSAYDRQRSSVYASYGLLQDGKNRELTSAEKQKLFEESLPTLLAEFDRDWKHIPLGFYFAATRLGMYTQTMEEKLELLEEAKLIVAEGIDVLDYTPGNVQVEKRIGEPIRFGRIISPAEEEVKNLNRAKNVARRLTIFRKLILPIREDSPEIIEE